MAYFGVSRHQRWFWADDWRQREAEVDAHVDAGKVDVHDGSDALFGHLDQLDTDD